LSFRITGLYLGANLCCPLARTGDGPFESLVCFCVLLSIVLMLQQQIVLLDPTQTRTQKQTSDPKGPSPVLVKGQHKLAHKNKPVIRKDHLLF
jgi:hypothetical protein